MKIILLLLAVMLLMAGADARYSPGLEIAENENITLDGGYLVESGSGGIAFNGTAPSVTSGILYSNAGELEFDGQPVIPNYYYTYTGTTGGGLDDFIALNGPGTYRLTNPITISSGISIDTSGVRIKGSAVGPINTTFGGSIACSMLSGNAITITADDVSLEDLYIYNSNAASSATLVNINETSPGLTWRNRVTDCYMDPKGGKGILLNGARIAHLIRPYIVGDTNVSSVGIQVGVSGGADNIDIYLQDAHIGAVGDGIRLVYGEGVYINGGDILLNEKSLNIAPYADDAVVNIISRGVCYDSSTNCSVYAAGTYTAKRLLFDTVWGYSNAAPVYKIKNVDELSITNGRIGVDANSVYIHAIELDDVDHSVIANNIIKTVAVGSAGIWFSGGCINGTITGNSINTKGIGVVLDTNANETTVIGNSARGGILNYGTNNVVLADSNNVA